MSHRSGRFPTSTSTRSLVGRSTPKGRSAMPIHRIFIRRGMPWQQPKSLTDDEVYALTAFILAKNKLIGETDTMNPETLPKVRMPNRGGFIIRFPDKI